MKKNLKKLTAVMLSLAMTLSLFPSFTVAAEGPAASVAIGSDAPTEYGSIEAAWDAATDAETTAQNKATITLLQDCTVEENRSLTNTDDFIILNLNGHTLTTTKGTTNAYGKILYDKSGIVVEGGELEVTGTGTIATKLYGNTYDTAALNVTGGKVTVDGPTIHSTLETSWRCVAVNVGAEGEFHFKNGILISDAEYTLQTAGGSKVHLYSGIIQGPAAFPVCNSGDIILEPSNTPLTLVSNSTAQIFNGPLKVSTPTGYVADIEHSNSADGSGLLAPNEGEDDIGYWLQAEGGNTKRYMQIRVRPAGPVTPTTYAVTFNTDGAESVAPTMDAAAAGATITLPAAPTKTGYTFTGWSDGTTTYQAGATYTMPAKAVTFTAQWTEDAPAANNVASVTFDGNIENYETFDDAWDAAIGLNTTAEKKATITLLADYECSEKFVNAEDYIVLDTAGKTLTLTHLYTTAGELEVTGSGTIKASDRYGALRAHNSCRLIVNGPTILNTAANGTAVSFFSGSTFILKAGNLIAESYAVQNESDDTTTELYSGTLKTTNPGASAVIYGEGTVTMKPSEAPLTFINSGDSKIFGYKYASVSVDGNAIISYGDDVEGNDTTPFEGEFNARCTANSAKYLKIVKAATPTTYEVTVENGTTTAAAFEAGATVTITADAPAAGKVFDKWMTDDGVEFADATSATTTFTMPANAVTVTATYKNATYTAIVTNGEGDNSYEAGATVTITADAPAAGKVFDKWTTEDGVEFADATSATTTFTMPAKAVTVTATYKNAPVADPVATVTMNGMSPETFATIEEAWNAAKAKTTSAQNKVTITLNKNCTATSSSLNNNLGDYIILDTAGYTLTLPNSGCIQVAGNGELEVKGSGTIQGYDENPYMASQGILRANGMGDLIVNGTTVVNTATTGVAVSLESTSTFILKAGNLTAGTIALMPNGSSTTATLYSGTLKNTDTNNDGYPLVRGGGTVTIIPSAAPLIFINNGQSVIFGASASVSGDADIRYSSNVSGEGAISFEGTLTNAANNLANLAKYLKIQEAGLAPAAAGNLHVQIDFDNTFGLLEQGPLPALNDTYTVTMKDANSDDIDGLTVNAKWQQVLIEDGNYGFIDADVYAEDETYAIKFTITGNFTLADRFIRNVTNLSGGSSIAEARVDGYTTVTDGNIVLYAMAVSSDDPPADPPAVDPYYPPYTPELPTGKPSTGESDGWDEIIDEVKDEESKEEINVDMNGNTVVPKEVINAIADGGNSMNLDVDPKANWTLHEEDLEPTDDDVDFAVDVDVNLTINGNKAELELSQKGDFPGTPVLNVELGQQHKGRFANLYDEDGNLIHTSRIDKDGYASWPMDEGGSYTVEISDSTDMTDGWKLTPSGTWYHYNEKIERDTRWLLDGNAWYFLRASGAMKTGWHHDADGHWYWMYEWGGMKEGWHLDTDGNWYFLRGNGAMATNHWRQEEDGRWYYLGANGAMLKNTVTPDGYRVDANGLWIR